MDVIECLNIFLNEHKDVEKIINDQMRLFNAVEFTNNPRKKSIKHVFTFHYNPTANSTVEIINKWFKNILRLSKGKNLAEMPEIIERYNNLTVNRITGYSRFDLNFNIHTWCFSVINEEILKLQFEKNNQKHFKRRKQQNFIKKTVWIL